MTAKCGPCKEFTYLCYWRCKGRSWARRAAASLGTRIQSRAPWQLRTAHVRETGFGIQRVKVPPRPANSPLQQQQPATNCKVHREGTLYPLSLSLALSAPSLTFSLTLCFYPCLPLSLTFSLYLSLSLSLSLSPSPRTHAPTRSRTKQSARKRTEYLDEARGACCASSSSYPD